MALNKTTLAKRTVMDIYGVSRLVRESRVAIEGQFPLIWVEGELSNVAMPASGHIYFTLKDEAAQVRCAMFKNRNRQLRFTPEKGMQVLLRVKVTLYEGRGEFQLLVEHMEEAGNGALQRAYEALKFRLGDEGLFDSVHKKALPTLPQTIGIISSPDGAAVHDILTVLKRRFPVVNVILYPVSVQGAISVQQITSEVALADKRQECDVLIVSRGGGSLEDLWGFNDELVARAIFQCSLPVISAIGHEVDFTIADFVADARAATPSAAAEIAVPDKQELINKIQDKHRQLNGLVTHYLTQQQQRLRYLVQALPHPQSTLSQQMQKLDHLVKQADRAWQQQIKNKQQQLAYQVARLKHPSIDIEIQQQKVDDLLHRLKQTIRVNNLQYGAYFNSVRQRLIASSPLTFVWQQQQSIEQIKKELASTMKRKIVAQQSGLEQKMRTLSAVSPLNTLERGYSITTDTVSKSILQTSDKVEIGQRVDVTLKQGQLACKVIGVKND